MGARAPAPRATVRAVLIALAAALVAAPGRGSGAAVGLPGQLALAGGALLVAAATYSAAKAGRAAGGPDGMGRSR